jgi:hypothetical protein
MERKSVPRPVTGVTPCAAAVNPVSPAFSEAAALPCSSSAGAMGRNSAEPRQLVTRVTKPYQLRAAHCSRREGALRC